MNFRSPYLSPHYLILLAFLWAVGCVALTPTIALAAPQLETFPQDTVLIQLNAAATLEDRDALIAQMGGELVAWIPQIQVVEVRLPVQAGISSVSLPASVSEMVTFVEPNLTISAPYEPNDPDFGDERERYGIEQVQALHAWRLVTGSPDIVIAVIDSGINPNHPEFVGRLVPGYDFIDQDDEPEDVSGHGTHVAGIIAAALDNGQGVAGICPNCRIMPVKVLSNNLSTWRHMADGIIFAVDNGARVINLSLGTDLRSPILESAVDYAVEQGVIVVAGAGNSAVDKPFYPAAFDGVIGVSATTRQGEKWGRSNFGSYVDLSAPGELIFNTYHDLENLFLGYTYMSGTSMSAAFVSGVAGILLSVEPDLSAEQVYEAMRLGAEDLGEAGWDPVFGYGRVNVMGALRAPVAGLVEAVGEIDLPAQEASVFLPVLSNR